MHDDERLTNKVKKNVILIQLLTYVGLSFLIPINFLAMTLPIFIIISLINLVITIPVLLSDTLEPLSDLPFILATPICAIVSFVIFIIIQYNFYFFNFSTVWLFYIGAYLISLILILIVINLLVHGFYLLFSFDPDDVLDYFKRKKKDNIYDLTKGK